MNHKTLQETVRAMAAPGRGILAADESTGTIAKRFATYKIANDEEHRRAYREMLFTTAGMAEFVSGVILYEETLGQKARDGTPFPALLSRLGVVPGIKVDQGAKDLAGASGEKITEGLDGLRERLAGYREKGARFAKWRAVITIGAGIPSDYCIDANAHALARYAALCQEADIVPIVEPEVLMDADNTIETCYDVTARTLQSVFDELWRQRVVLELMVLKPNMVIAGKKCAQQAPVQAVAERTLDCFHRHVPSAVPLIAFLSGGQSDEDATAHLSAMNALGPHPWELSFSYGRALQAPSLAAWAGKADKVSAGQRAFLHRARMNGAARRGAWKPNLEKQLVGA